jgi:hypothetical protein
MVIGSVNTATEVTITKFIRYPSLHYLQGMDLDIPDLHHILLALPSSHCLLNRYFNRLLSLVLRFFFIPCGSWNSDPSETVK